VKLLFSFEDLSPHQKKKSFEEFVNRLREITQAEMKGIYSNYGEMSKVRYEIIKDGLFRQFDAFLKNIFQENELKEFYQQPAGIMFQHLLCIFIIFLKEDKEVKTEFYNFVNSEGFSLHVNTLLDMLLEASPKKADWPLYAEILVVGILFRYELLPKEESIKNKFNTLLELNPKLKEKAKK
jgi:hypothetical protein